MKLALSLIIFSACFAVSTGAADSPLLTELRVKETAPRTCFCTKKELKIADLGEFAPDAITRLVEKATELKLGQGGPIMLTYFDFMGDPNQTFTAEFALPIKKGGVPKTDDLYVREAPKFKCASVIFQGPLTKIGEAWHSFVASAMAKGQPTGEHRELYLYFESPESLNNIVELQMGLK